MSVDLGTVIRDIVADEVKLRVADEVERQLALIERAEPSPHMTVPEAMTYLRCKRQRIDDLLSQRKLTRVKDGGTIDNPRSGRTLLLRAEIEALTWVVD